MKRLNTDTEIAPIVAQFVPVKLDVDSPEYREWRSNHKAEGSTIPKLFIVRADGETLYGKSGSLSGNALPRMLTSALRHSGSILTPRDATTIMETTARFQELKDAGDISRAIKALSKVKRLGVPGKIKSYATSATQLNDLVNEMSKQVADKLAELQKSLEESSANEEAEIRLSTTMAFLRLKNDYGGLQSVKPQILAFQKLLSRKEHSQLFREARIIDAALSAKTKSSTKRAIEKLGALIESSEIEVIKTLATKTLGDLQADSAD